MPTATDSQPISLRLEHHQIEHLRLLARCKSLAQGRKIGYTDLIRDAVLAAYPVLQEITKMSDIERLCWTQVNTGVEILKITGENACIISQGGSRHPAGSAHTVALVEHDYAARAHDLHIIPISVPIRSSAQTEETEDYVLLSKEPAMSPVEIQTYIPAYTIPAYIPGGVHIEATEEHPGQDNQGRIIPKEHPDR